MKRILLYIFTSILLVPLNGSAQDYLSSLKKKDRDRATYWEKRGYHFDYKCTSAPVMDQRVKNLQRSDYWKKRGYHFDSKYLSASTMDKKAKDIQRADYWKKRGYQFNPDHMSASMMDLKMRSKLAGTSRKTYPISSKASGSIIKYRTYPQLSPLNYLAPTKKNKGSLCKPSSFKNSGKKNTPYNTYKRQNGDTAIRGSGGGTYNTYRYSNGDSVTHGSDGSSYNTYRYSNGDSVTRGSDGSTYNTHRYSNGDSITRGSNGSIFNTWK